MDLQAIRKQVASGNYALRPHTMQHAVKEGFAIDDIIHIILSGSIVEDYPERFRCLLSADTVVEGIKVPLHVVCEQREPESAVAIVTAYIPSEWATPTRRKKL